MKESQPSPSVLKVIILNKTNEAKVEFYNYFNSNKKSLILIAVFASTLSCDIVLVIICFEVNCLYFFKLPLQVHVIKIIKCFTLIKFQTHLHLHLVKSCNQYLSPLMLEGVIKQYIFICIITQTS